MGNKHNRKQPKRHTRAWGKPYSCAVVETFHRSTDGSEMAFETLNDEEMRALIGFFRTLDRWDRAANGDPEEH